MAIEPRDSRQRAALDLDDRDPQARGMENESLERLAPARDHEQPQGGAARDERFLDRATAGDQLFALGQEVRRRDRASVDRGRPSGLPGAPTAGSARPIAGRRSARTAWLIEPAGPAVGFERAGSARPIEPTRTGPRPGP